MKTLSELLREGRQELAQCRIENGEADAWYLLEYVCGIDKNYYFMHTDDIIEEAKEEQYRLLVGQRSRHVPLQYLTHTAYFMGLSFCVNEHVLIPRQDTEILVETILERIPEGARVLDLCTGSGCIVISLLKYGRGFQGTGSDISEDALVTAGKNAAQNSVNARFIKSDLFENIEGRYDVIVSNPPYIRTDVIPTLMDEVRLHEPLLALDGKDDGLYFYRQIIRQAGQYLEEDGMLAFEIGFDQGEALTELLCDAGYRDVEIIRDLGGRNRVVLGKKCSKRRE